MKHRLILLISISLLLSLNAAAASKTKHKKIVYPEIICKQASIQAMHNGNTMTTPIISFKDRVFQKSEDDIFEAYKNLAMQNQNDIFDNEKKRLDQYSNWIKIKNTTTKAKAKFNDPQNKIKGFWVTIKYTIINRDHYQAMDEYTSGVKPLYITYKILCGTKSYFPYRQFKEEQKKITQPVKQESVKLI